MSTTPIGLLRPQAVTSRLTTTVGAAPARLADRERPVLHIIVDSSAAKIEYVYRFERDHDMTGRPRMHRLLDHSAAAVVVAFVLTCASTLAARGKSPAAFDGRCIPAGCVAPRSNTPGILGRRALPSGRLARLGATPDFHHGLLGRNGIVPRRNSRSRSDIVSGACARFFTINPRPA